jgi:hypothetical protein
VNEPVPVGANRVERIGIPRAPGCAGGCSPSLIPRVVRPRGRAAGENFVRDVACAAQAREGLEELVTAEPTICQKSPGREPAAVVDQLERTAEVPQERATVRPLCPRA